MKVVRRQHPIGQGNFHTASISLEATEQHPTEEKFNYVYDCGSDNYSALNREIGVFVHSNKKVDALFISHLDSDHVSGLDRLIAGIEIDTVYLPYVDDMLTLMDLLEEDASVGLTGSLIEAALDPAGFFGRRGVRRVVRVRPGGAPDSAGLILPDLPPEPKFGGGPITAKENPQAKLIMNQTKGELATLCEMEKDTVIMLHANGVIFDWVLVPHVTPAPRENTNAFKKAIRKALTLTSGQRLTNKRLIEGLFNMASRKAFKKCL
jgi:Metallo-beta-lactamase superfamily